MKFSGIIKNSFVDYPSKISTVLFTVGCNMNCYYCHNAKTMNRQNCDLTDESVLNFLSSRRDFIDAIVISGGEPTMQNDLVEFCQKIKKLNFYIKLDTNGSNPEILKVLLDNRLVDYVAMDIKASKQKYKSICGKSFEDISTSIELLKKSNIDYEFRSTVCDKLSLIDYENINEIVKNGKMFYLQRCNEPNVNYEEKTKLLLTIKAQLDKNIKTEIRNL